MIRFPPSPTDHFRQPQQRRCYGTDSENPPERQSAFQLRRHDQKVNATLFQGALLALAGLQRQLVTRFGKTA